MSETLFIEGPTTDAVIADIRNTYGTAVEIQSVKRSRTGGVLGFFSRESVGVSFRVNDPIDEADRLRADFDPPSLADLVGEADGADGPRAAVAASATRTPPPRTVAPPVVAMGRDLMAGPARPTNPRPVPATAFASNAVSAGARTPAAALVADRADLVDTVEIVDGTDVADRAVTAVASRPNESALADAVGGPEFAELLSALAAGSTATASPMTPLDLLADDENAAGLYTVPTRTPRTPARRSEVTSREATVTPARTEHAPPARAGSAALDRLAMLTDLRTLGVPVSMNPQRGQSSLYAAIEEIVDELPTAPQLPMRAGDIVVVTGSGEQVRAGAIALAMRMHLPPGSVWFAGGPAGSDHRVDGPADAARKAKEFRTSDLPSIVVVPLFGPSPGDSGYGWTAQMLAALQPTAVWAAVDAGRKTEDLTAELSGLGTIDALLVTNAARTASPATVWDLEIPVAMLDGRPATRGTWAGLLFDALRRAGGK